MITKILIYSLILVSVGYFGLWVFMENPWCLLVGVCTGLLAWLLTVDSKLTAPLAEKNENPFGYSDHQTVYVRALFRTLEKIDHARANGGHLAGVDSMWRKEYEHAKWTYSLLYCRYMLAREKYGWNR